MKKVVKAEGIEPKGPYSPAIMSGDWLFISGQIGTPTGDIEKETEEAMMNIKKLLESQGMSMDNVVKATLYVKEGEDFSKVNSAYEEFLREPYPARSTVFVSSLPKGALIEIEIIARR